MAETTAKKPAKTTASKAGSAKPAKKAAPKKEADSSLFAVIATGGKQYQVSVGDVITVEKMLGEYKAGDTITFDKVLLVDDGANTTVGTPFISGASVTGELQEEGRGRKVVVIKYKAKSRYFKKNGHRQPYFKIRINAIK